MLLALLLSAAAVHACSCAGAWSPDVADCAASERIFAATVATSRPPRGMEWVLDPTPWTVELEVDRVYRGQVAPRIATAVSAHPGGCGLPLVPGTPVLVCDDRPAAEGPRLSLCSSPALHDHAVELEAELQLRGFGPATAPTAPSAWWPRPRPWLWAYLVSPLVLACGALAWGRRRVSDARHRLRTGRVWGAVLALGLLARLVGHGASLSGMSMAVVFGPGLVLWGVAALVSVGVGRAWGQRRLVGRWPTALLVLLAGPGLLVAAHVPMVLPVDRPDAIDCSVDRARILLAAGDDLSAAVAAQPHACTWWGTAAFEVTRASKFVPGGCLRFPDADRQTWTVCPNTAPVVSVPSRWSAWD